MHTRYSLRTCLPRWIGSAGDSTIETVKRCLVPAALIRTLAIATLISVASSAAYAQDAGTVSGSSGTGLRRWATAVATGVSATKGLRPARHSNATTARE